MLAMLSYILNAGVGAIVWWLESDQPRSPEQMAVWLYQLSMASINVSLGQTDKDNSLAMNERDVVSEGPTE